MKTDDVVFTIFKVFLGSVFGMLTLIFIQEINGVTYKQGQIDALNGKIKYKKELQTDSSVIWVEVKEQK